MTQVTISKFVSDVASVAVKAGKLQDTLQTMMQAAKDQKAFKTELYAAAKAKGDLAYNAVRQLYSRALKALGWAKTDNRGGKDAKTEKGAQTAPKAQEKASGMTDALAIARVGQLATSFLTADDKLVMTRLLAAISHKLEGATKSKK